MTISQMEAEPNLSEGQQQQDFEDAQQQEQQLEKTFHEEQRGRPQTAQTSKRNPPARNTSRFWFERFLAVIQRQNPSVIDASFLSQIAPSNEGKLLAQLKFLRVIDEQGKPTEVLPMLNMVGDEQKKAFQEIAKDSYGDLFGEVKVDKAVPDDLVNFFIRKYSFTRDKAIHAARFFVYLADKGSIPLSQELANFFSEKGSPSPAQNGNSSTALSTARAIERPFLRESRVAGASSQAKLQGLRKSPSRSQGTEDEKESNPSIHATITISLDKDTPKEYWDRVLSLLGEKRNAAESASQVDIDQSSSVVTNQDSDGGEISQ